MTEPKAKTTRRAKGTTKLGRRKTPLEEKQSQQISVYTTPSMAEAIQKGVEAIPGVISIAQLPRDSALVVMQLLCPEVLKGTTPDGYEYDFTETETVLSSLVKEKLQANRIENPQMSKKGEAAISLLVKQAMREVLSENVDKGAEGVKRSSGNKVPLDIREITRKK